jgi:hypothetical protein
MENKMIPYKIRLISILFYIIASFVLILSPIIFLVGFGLIGIKNFDDSIVQASSYYLVIFSSILLLITSIFLFFLTNKFKNGVSWARYVVQVISIVFIIGSMIAIFNKVYIYFFKEKYMLIVLDILRSIIVFVISLLILIYLIKNKDYFKKIRLMK